MKRKKNPRIAQFNVRVSDEQLEQLRRKAYDSSESISTVVREALEKARLITVDGIR